MRILVRVKHCLMATIRRRSTEPESTDDLSEFASTLGPDPSKWCITPPLGLSGLYVHRRKAAQIPVVQALLESQTTDSMMPLPVVVHVRASCRTLEDSPLLYSKTIPR